MRLDTDVVVMAAATVGVLMGIGSALNAALELIECMRSEPPINGATHLSAVALATKAVLTVLAQFALLLVAIRYARDTEIVLPPEFTVAVFALTAKSVYDYLFHLRLYRMVKPKNPKRRRSSD